MVNAAAVLNSDYLRQYADMTKNVELIMEQIGSLSEDEKKESLPEAPWHRPRQERVGRSHAKPRKREVSDTF